MNLGGDSDASPSSSDTSPAPDAADTDDEDENDAGDGLRAADFFGAGFLRGYGGVCGGERCPRRCAETPPPAHSPRV